MASEFDPMTLALLGGAGYLAYAWDKSLWPFSAASAIPPAIASAPPTTSGITPLTPAPPGLPTAGASPANPNLPYVPPGMSPSTLPIPSGSTSSTQTISQRMVALGGSGPFNMDQWCYYYSEATGNPCPVDPGAIPDGVYSGAGIVDRTTPTDVGTWLAIMQNQNPGAGLTGYGLGNGTTTAGYATPALVNSLLTAEGIQLSGYDVPWWMVAAIGAGIIYFVAGGKK